MQIGSELAAFRGSTAAQDAAQGLMIRSAADWKAGETAAPVLAGLERYGDGESLSAIPALSDLFGSGKAARTFADVFLVQAARAMARTPLSQPCFRHSCEGGYTLIHIAHSGRASLSLVVVEGDGGAVRPVPASATFTAAERVELVLAGAASGEIATLENACLERKERAFATGDVLHLPPWSTRIFHHVDASLVCLRLARTPERMPATRQVNLSNGTVLHYAAGDPRDTRHELMGALLSAMGREDAVPALAQLAVAIGHGPTRWQAMKSALALDTAAGFGALSSLVDDPDDPLHSDASALRTALVARHPVLGTLEQA